jgi:signal transduction histidine kinase
VSTQAGTNFLLMSFTLLSLLVSTIVLSKGIAKNRVFYTWMIGLVLGCSGTLQIGMSLLLENNSNLLDLTNDPFSRSPYVLSGLIFYLIALASQPLMFCGLRVSEKGFRYCVFGLLTAVIFFVAVIKIITIDDDYLIRLFVLHSFTMGMSIWLVIELKLLKRIAPTSTLQIIFAAAIVTTCLYSIWISIVLMNIPIIGIFSLGHDQINELDLNFRFLRGSLFIISEIIIFVYWLQTHSAIALAEAKNKESILNLLVEKDKLISHLVNTRALVETGALSAGVAHEVNQFLTRIQINAEEAESLIVQSAATSQVKEALHRIQDSVRSASNIITSIKQLFTKSDPDFSTTKIDLLLSSMMNIYSERASRSKISLEVAVEPGQQWFVSEILLRQVIANLIVNSIESLETVTRDKKKILIRSFVKDERLCIEVIDNGDGVPSNKVHNLFSLFSTNKRDGTGVGLWLSACIVEQHSGNIRYAKSVEGGAMFLIEIPDVQQRFNNFNEVFS